MTGYSQYRAPLASVVLEYERTGSTVGKSRIQGSTNQQVDYAGSDSPLGEQVLRDRKLIMFPSMAG